MFTVVAKLGCGATEGDGGNVPFGGTVPFATIEGVGAVGARGNRVTSPTLS